MSGRKWVQRVKTGILAIVLVGCSTSKLPIVPTTTPPRSTPTKIPTLTATANPTPTAVVISSFEECIDSGVPVQDTFPPKCIRNNGEIFTEGVIFDKTFGTTGTESGIYISSTTDGGFLIAGYAQGCWVLRLDASGGTIWDASFNEELIQELQLEALYSCFLARETPDGDYVAMGTGFDVNFGTFYNAFFMITLDHQGNLTSGVLLSEKEGKTPYLDPDGNLIWLTSLGIIRQVYETLDGGYIIVGHFEHSMPDSSMHMIKTDKNGGYVWDRNWCLDKNIHHDWERKIVCGYNYSRDAIQLQDGSFVIIGVVGGGTGTWLIKTDSTGNIDWIQSYDFNGDALIQMPDSGFLIAGRGLNDQNNIDGILIKTDSVGDFQWSRNLGGTNSDGFEEIEQRPNGEIILMGWSSKRIGEEPPYFIDKKLWLIGIESKILE